MRFSARQMLKRSWRKLSFRMIGNPEVIAKRRNRQLEKTPVQVTGTTNRALLPSYSSLARNEANRTRSPVLHCICHIAFHSVYPIHLLYHRGLRVIRRQGGTSEDRATILRPFSLPNQSALAGSVVPVRQATSDQLFRTARHQNPGSLRSSRICGASSSACGGSTMGYRRPSVVVATRIEPSGGVGMLARRLVYAWAFAPARSIFVVTLVA